MCYHMFFFYVETDQQWDGSAIKLRDSKAFDEFLLVASQLNQDLSAAKKRDPHLDDLLSLFGVSYFEIFQIA